MILNKEEIWILIDSLMVRKVKLDGEVYYQRVHFSDRSENPTLIAKLSIMLEMAK